MRPRTNADDAIRDAVERYARDHGLTVAQAWTDLVVDGIEANGYDIHERKDSDGEQA